MRASLAAWALRACCAAALVAASHRAHARADAGADTSGTGEQAAPDGATEDETTERERDSVPEAVRSAYEGYVAAALREYRAHRFPEARSLFDKAHATLPSARTLRGLAMVEFELRNYVESAELFERALAERVRPLLGALRLETEQLQRKADGFVAHYEIASDRPVIVTVDSVRPDPTRGPTLSLCVGDHVLEFAALGYASQRRRVRVRGGERETLEIALEPLEPSVAKTKSRTLAPARRDKPFLDAEVSPREPRRLYQNKWLWTAVTVGAAAIATGVALALTSHGQPTDAPIAARPVAIRNGP